MLLNLILIIIVPFIILYSLFSLLICDLLINQIMLKKRIISLCNDLGFDYKEKIMSHVDEKFSNVMTKKEYNDIGIHS